MNFMDEYEAELLKKAQEEIKAEQADPLHKAKMGDRHTRFLAELEAAEKYAAEHPEEDDEDEEE